MEDKTYSFDVYRLGFEQIPKSTTNLASVQKPLKKLYLSYQKALSTNPPLSRVRLNANKRGLSVDSILNTEEQNATFMNETLIMDNQVNFRGALIFTSQSNEKKKNRYTTAFVNLDPEFKMKNDKEYNALFSSLDEKENFIIPLEHPPLFVCVNRSRTSKNLELRVFACLSEEQALDIMKALKAEPISDFRSKAYNENVEAVYGTRNDLLPTGALGESVSNNGSVNSSTMPQQNQSMFQQPMPQNYQQNPYEMYAQQPYNGSEQPRQMPPNTYLNQGYPPNAYYQYPPYGGAYPPQFMPPYPQDPQQQQHQQLHHQQPQHQQHQQPQHQQHQQPQHQQHQQQFQNQQPQHFQQQQQQQQHQQAFFQAPRGSQPPQQTQQEISKEKEEGLNFTPMRFPRPTIDQSVNNSQKEMNTLDKNLYSQPHDPTKVHNDPHQARNMYHDKGFHFEESGNRKIKLGEKKTQMPPSHTTEEAPSTAPGSQHQKLYPKLSTPKQQPSPPPPLNQSSGQSHNFPPQTHQPPHQPYQPLNQPYQPLNQPYQPPNQPYQHPHQPHQPSPQTHQLPPPAHLQPYTQPLIPPAVFSPPAELSSSPKHLSPPPPLHTSRPSSARNSLIEPKQVDSDDNSAQAGDRRPRTGPVPPVKKPSVPSPSFKPKSQGSSTSEEAFSPGAITNGKESLHLIKPRKFMGVPVLPFAPNNLTQQLQKGMKLKEEEEGKEGGEEGKGGGGGKGGEGGIGGEGGTGEEQKVPSQMDEVEEALGYVP